jgi:hypothetical protein
MQSVLSIGILSIDGSDFTIHADTKLVWSGTFHAHSRGISVFPSRKWTLTDDEVDEVLRGLQNLMHRQLDVDLLAALAAIDEAHTSLERMHGIQRLKEYDFALSAIDEAKAAVMQLWLKLPPTSPNPHV